MAGAAAPPDEAAAPLVVAEEAVGEEVTRDRLSTFIIFKLSKLSNKHEASDLPCYEPTTV